MSTINRCKRGITILAPFIVITCWPAAGHADLGKIDRTIGKEPVYQSKNPKYCLVIPDSAARTRIWLVLDGDVLYVDRNMNGDLTEAGEKIEPKPVLLTGLRAPGTKEPKALNFDCSVGKDWQIRVLTIEENYVQVDVHDGVRQLDFVTSGLQFAKRPQDAPIIYCGPLTFLPGTQTLKRGEKPDNFTVHIGRQGAGPVTSTSINVAAVPADKHPVADFEFPKKDRPGETIRMRVVLDHRC